jgi:NAD+-dependent protein deacetylase sirtuin 5
MPSPTKSLAGIAAADLETFTTHLRQSRRILAILGAGISASSGLPTFRGAGGFWRSYDATSLATPSAFLADPGLVWQFYSYRRHMALNAKPNRAHYALAELARRLPGFVTLSQNVDGLSTRAGHPEAQLKLLHGSLFDVRCDDDKCGYMRHNDFTDPITPALAIPCGDDASIAAQSAKKPNQALTAEVAQKGALIKGIDISHADVPLSTLPASSLPQCPECQTSLLRPGVVWFGEPLPPSVLSDIDAYFNEIDSETKAEGQGKHSSTGQPQAKKIDLCLVIGTSSQVYPAAGYASKARSHGARVAVFNMDRSHARDLWEGDWYFEGDAAEIVPEILKSVIGDV